MAADALLRAFPDRRDGPIEGTHNFDYEYVARVLASKACTRLNVDFLGATLFVSAMPCLGVD